MDRTNNKRQSTKAGPGNNESLASLGIPLGIPFKAWKLLVDDEYECEDAEMYREIGMKFLNERCPNLSEFVLPPRNPHVIPNHPFGRESVSSADAPAADPRINVQDAPRNIQTPGVFQYLLEPLRLVRMFDTLAQAERATGIPASMIQQACSAGTDADKRTVVHGYYFCHEIEFLDVVNAYGTLVEGGFGVKTFQCLYPTPHIQGIACLFMDSK